MPAQVIDLFDFAFELLNHEAKEALNHLEGFEREFPEHQHFATLLRYIAADFAAPDEGRVRRAKKVLLDALEQFCLVELAQKP